MTTVRNMPFQKILLLCFCGAFFLGHSQQASLSPSAKISIITCGAGNELYSTFGHSAFRIHDPALRIDVVYNYGTFNFNTPNFYMKFAQGKLWYSLSRQQFDIFLYEYQLENRWVKEQILNLTPSEKNGLFRFLENNYLPENREYKYDFFFDNCSTKMGAVLEAAFGKSLQYDYAHLKDQYTFRELIHQNLHTNSWSAFGIDLALGSVIDRTATPHEHLFLPAYVMRQMEHTVLGTEPLVQQERSILDKEPRPQNGNFLGTPLFYFLIVLLLVLLVSYRDFKERNRSNWLDIFLFMATGLAGLVILFLWFLTDHSATLNNFNVLWAFPLNVVFAIYLMGKRTKAKVAYYYTIGLMALLAIAAVLWVMKIQVFSPLVVPLWVVLGIRYLFLHFNFKKGKPAVRQS